MDNPYSKEKDEAKFLTWQHGASSASEEENPYEADSQEELERVLHGVWKKGYTSVKRQPKKKAKVETTEIVGNDANGSPVVEVVNKESNKAVADLPDHILIAELKGRKQKDLDALNKRIEALVKEAQGLSIQRERLQALMDL